MFVTTKNTVYILNDMGDGAFLIQGNPKYCPLPTMCRLWSEPEVGGKMVFVPVEGHYKDHPIATTTITDISNPGVN